MRRFYCLKMEDKFVADTKVKVEEGFVVKFSYLDNENSSEGEDDLETPTYLENDFNQ